MKSKQLKQLPEVPAAEQSATNKLRPTHRKAAVAGFILPALISVAAVTVAPQRQALGQTNLASITGSVTDSTGAALPNASVSIVNVETTAARVVTTDANGFYTAPSLTVGAYRITVTANGFTKTTLQPH